MILPSTPLPDRTRLLRWVAVFATFLVALFFRAWFQYDRVFGGSYVSFQENDPWYHVRAVEHLVANFPHRLTWDPYALHPGGQHIAIAPLFDWLCAAVALLLGGGKPSVSLVHAVCAWTPAVLGSLVVFPTYFLAATLRDARAGLIAAATIAVLCGPFLQRSLLGHADHHVAESFFAIVCLLFLSRLLRGWGEHPERRHIGDGLLFGVSLGLYLLSWVGAALVVLFIFLSLIAYAMLEHVRGRPVGKACVSTGAGMALALMMIAPFFELPGFTYHIVALAGATMFLILVAVWARLVRRHRRIYMPLGVAALGIIGPLLLRVVAPALFAEVLGAITRFVSGAAGVYVSEATPLLFEGGMFTLAPTYDAFGTTAATALLGMLVLTVGTWRDRPYALPFLIYSLFMILATLAQQRFAYYVAVNVAVLSGCFWSALLDGLGRWLRASAHALRIARSAAYASLAALSLYPSAAAAYAFAHQHNGPHSDWHVAMTWLRANTPEPFDQPDAFFRPYDERTGTPRSQYGVMCWWDHGYWITSMAHRVPTANPTQTGVNDAAAFFTAQDEEHAVQILDKLSARYVVVDDTLPSWETPGNGFDGKFGTLARWAGKDEFDLYEPYLVPDGEGGAYRPVVLYYPDYYRSMLNRLFIFGGQAYEPTWTTWAVRYTETTTPRGFRVKRAEKTLQFKTYAAAVEHLAAHPGEPWRIVGLNPGESCVPLEPLRGLRPVYQSPTPSATFGDRSACVVEIFERLRE